MGYIINKTDGSVLIPNLLDYTTDTSVGLTLIGRNYPNYGQAQNDNFVKLLENFADTTPPTESVGANSLTGTIWWDTGNKLLKVYDGTNWIPVSQQFSANSAPAASNLGDQWYDTVNQQLHVWTGTNWLLIGPAATASQGKTGVYVETVTDNTSNVHIVVNTYKANSIISVSSTDSEFIPTGPAYSNFSTVKPGVNVSNNRIFNGTAANTILAGGIDPGVFARTDIDTSFARNVLIAGNLAVGNGNISYNNNSLSLQNKMLLGNVDVYVNTTLGNVTAIRINGTTGLVTVFDDPILPTGVATKRYVDGSFDTLNENITNIQIEDQAALIASVESQNANLAIANAQQTANLNLAVATINSNINVLSASTDARFIAANLALTNAMIQQNANLAIAVAQQNANLSSTSNAINSNITALSDSTSARFNTVNSDLATKTNQIADIYNVQLPLKAPIFSPSFTGTPTAPTVSVTDNSTKIATTAYVTGAIQAQRFRYTVSPNGPSGGNDGDFWFRIG